MLNPINVDVRMTLPPVESWSRIAILNGVCVAAHVEAPGMGVLSFTKEMQDTGALVARVPTEWVRQQLGEKVITIMDAGTPGYLFETYTALTTDDGIVIPTEITTWLTDNGIDFDCYRYWFKVVDDSAVKRISEKFGMIPTMVNNLPVGE